VAFDPPSAQEGVEVVVIVFVTVVIFAPPMATNKLAEISTPAITMAEAMAM